MQRIFAADIGGTNARFALFNWHKGNLALERVAWGRSAMLDGTAGMADPKDMWRCQMVNCGYVYDPDRGDKRHKIPAGTRFEDLPDDWKCPVCGATKKSFRPLSDES